MAYCVNCGVELEKSQANCPLCGVEAVNPKEPYDPTLPKPYSARMARIQERMERRFVGWILTIVLVVVAVVCVMANLMYDGAVTWSIYVLSCAALVWVIVLLPLVYPGLHPVLMVLLDVCALLAFLYGVNLADRSSDWYMTLALPQVLLYGVLALLDIMLWRSAYVHGWQRYGVVVMSVGIAMMGLEVLLDMYHDVRVELGWSWFVVLPAFAAGLILFLLERKRELKDAIIKRMRI